MKAMILAAGRGERMRPLTDRCPKPLIRVGDHSLIEWHLMRLERAGFSEVVINLSWLGGLIRQQLGDGRQFGLTIHYAEERPRALETAGGIANVLSALSDPFLVINADTWFEFALPNESDLEKAYDAHLLMVKNPRHNEQGDFSIDGDTLVISEGLNTFTFSGVGLYRKNFFKSVIVGEATALLKVLRPAINLSLVSAKLVSGSWFDVGTLERLQEVRRFVGRQ